MKRYHEKSIGSLLFVLIDVLLCKTKYILRWSRFSKSWCFLFRAVLVIPSVLPR